jgi:hypothetical protein
MQGWHAPFGENPPLVNVPSLAVAVGDNQRVGVDEITDRLYALPPEEFTLACNLAVSELREAGQREQADQVRALRKPSAAAGAVNRLVHNHRTQGEAFLDAAARLRDAQFASKGDLGAAAQAERRALEELVDLVGEPVRASLQAAAVDDQVARDLQQAQAAVETAHRKLDRLRSN